MISPTLLIALILVPIIVLAILYFASRIIFRIAMLASTILFLLILGLGAYAVYDAHQFSEEIETTPSTYIFESDEPRAGFVRTSLSAEPELFTQTELIAWNEDPNMTTFLFTPTTFDQTDFEPPEQASYLTQDALLEIIAANDPFDPYARIVAENDPRLSQIPPEQARDIAQDELRDRLEDDTHARSEAFGILLAGTITAESEAFVIAQLQQGGIEIIPPRFFVRTLQLLPLNINYTQVIPDEYSQPLQAQE